MTFDDIVDLAEKAGCDVSAIDGREYQTMWCDYYQFERFASALIQAGAASRDVEIAELVAALEEVKRGLDQMFGDNVGMNGDGAYARCADFSGPIVKAALAKVRKP